MSAPQYENPKATLFATATALVKWLNAWRLLALVLGGLAFIGAAIGMALYGAELIGIYAPDTRLQLSLATVTLAVGAFFIWLVWTVLTDLMLWVIATLSTVGRASTDDNLTRLQRKLGSKLNLLTSGAARIKLPDAYFFLGRGRSCGRRQPCMSA